jgi:flagellar motor switch protein FliG
MAETTAAVPARAKKGQPPEGAAGKEPGGLQKAAILILSLDEETASLLLKSLSDSEAELITREIAKMGVIDKDQITTVLKEFTELTRVQEFIREGGTEQAVKLIKKAFPAATAQRLTRLLEMQKQSIPFGFLKNAEADSLHTFLQEEHPQTIALVLSYVEPAKAAEVLSKLPTERQLDIVKRIAHLEHTSPEAIKHVETGLEKHLTSLAFEELQDVGGVKTVAEILNVIDRNTEKAILENLAADSQGLVDEIKKLMFVFEDVVQVDDKGVQNVLKEVDNKKLALALKTASAALKEKVFKNMSQRAAEMVKEEIGFLGPVRVADVESAQQEIVDIVRRLEESGEVIILGRGAESELVV